MSKISKEGFINFFRYFKGEEHQEDAVGIFYDQLPDELKDESNEWITTYRTPDNLPPEETSNPLNVPYQSQNDNASGTGYRECFSSSCAMVAMYYGKVKNDDDYNKIRAEFGDSTDPQAQVRALRSIGLDATFITNATTDLVKDCIESGRPVPCGWLHNRSVGYPTGGGHYSVVIGFSDKERVWYVHDPNGEADLIKGGYTSNRNGASMQYSYSNWNPRWIVEGEGSGWMMDIRDHAKK